MHHFSIGMSLHRRFYSLLPNKTTLVRFALLNPKKNDLFQGTSLFFAELEPTNLNFHPESNVKNHNFIMSRCINGATLPGLSLLRK